MILKILFYNMSKRRQKPIEEYYPSEFINWFNSIKTLEEKKQYNAQEEFDFNDKTHGDVISETFVYYHGYT